MRALLLSLALFSANALAADEWVELFNGKDLSNWVNVNCAPETWRVEDGVIKCTGNPTGALRTPQMYENFVMEVEWRHMKSGGNAGIFIWASPIAAKGAPFLRAVEVQVLDHGYGNTKSYTTHGDVFPIWGTTMVPIGRHNGSRSFPSEERSKPSPEWNHYRIECRDGSIRLSVNGKEVSGGDQCNWRKGYVGLESEGSPTEWRLVRIKELPGGNAPAAETADEAKGHVPLYNGLDLRGWKTETPGRWKASDWQLRTVPGDAGGPLWAERELGDFELIVDVNAGKSAKAPAILLRGKSGKEARVPLDAVIAKDGAEVPKGVEPGNWNRVKITAEGRKAMLQINGTAITTVELEEVGEVRMLGIEDPGAEVSLGNLYVRPL